MKVYYGKHDRMAYRQTSLNPEPSTFRDVYEILRLPILLAAIAIAGTWVVWYFTHASCSEELARATGCNPSAIAGYISLDALNKIVTHAVIAGGGGGLWSYAMITRQRKIIEALEHQLSEERERAAEEREHAAQERAHAAEERRQLLATIESLTERLSEQQNGGSGQSES